jgi:hypothetical protein
MVKLKDSDLEEGYEYELDPEKGKWIIETKLNAIVATTRVQPSELEEPEEGEHFFHSQMWVKGNPLHSIFDSVIKKNLISVDIIKKLNLSITPHPHPYTIEWLL